jgi:hypothetical protein
MNNYMCEIVYTNRGNIAGFCARERWAGNQWTLFAVIDPVYDACESGASETDRRTARRTCSLVLESVLERSSLERHLEKF